MPRRQGGGVDWMTSTAGGGLFANFQVFADADTREPTGDAPRDDAVAVFETIQGKFSVQHDKVATSTGNLAAGLSLGL